MANSSIEQNTQVLPREQEETSEKRLNEILSSYEGKKEELIPILQQVQQAFGYLPEPMMKKIAKFLQLPESTIFGVSTFYAQFKLVPSGRNIIRVCRGTACHVRGAPEVLNEIENQLNINVGETTPDNNFTLETVRCLGTCAIGPVVTIDGKYYGQMNSKKIRSILKEYKRKIERVLV